MLLLNTCLTVEEGQPASHAGKGWEVLTDAIIRKVSEGDHPVLFMLWGAHAQSKRALVDLQRHKVLIANHPSPLSAMRPPLPFIGCGHFSEGQSLARGERREPKDRVTGICYIFNSCSRTYLLAWRPI